MNGWRSAVNNPRQPGDFAGGDRVSDSRHKFAADAGRLQWNLGADIALRKELH
jgi:hypothetical protein